MLFIPNMHGADLIKRALTQRVSVRSVHHSGNQGTPQSKGGKSTVHIHLYPVIIIHYTYLRINPLYLSMIYIHYIYTYIYTAKPLRETPESQPMDPWSNRCPMPAGCCPFLGSSCHTHPPPWSTARRPSECQYGESAAQDPWDVHQWKMRKCGNGH